jgi:hypothetical protein
MEPLAIRKGSFSKFHLDTALTHLLEQSCSAWSSKSIGKKCSRTRNALSARCSSIINARAAADRTSSGDGEGYLIGRNAAESQRDQMAGALRIGSKSIFPEQHSSFGEAQILPPFFPAI